MEKELWIETVIESSTGIPRVLPDKALFAKIRNRIQNQNVPIRLVYLAAASLLVLISLNVKIVVAKSANEKSGTAVVAKYLSRSNQLY
jgi:hypothetical protein